MGSDRNGYRMMATRRRQAGITVIGFLILASLVGVVGLAAIKLVPMYMMNMRLSTVLEDIKRDLDGKGSTPTSIRNAIAKRFSIETMNIPSDNIKINQGKNGYEVRIQYENRAPYVADIWLLVAFDKQVEIRR
jgi:Domain of unknown function (DUF4845)